MNVPPRFPFKTSIVYYFDIDLGFDSATTIMGSLNG